MTPQTDDISPEIVASLKKLITPTDVILNVPIRFEHLGETLTIHGKTAAQLEAIDNAVIDIIEIAAQRIPPPAPPADDEGMDGHQAEMQRWFTENRTRQRKVYRTTIELIEKILTPPPGVNGTKPVGFDWLYKNLQLTWGEYIPVGATGLPDQWWDAPQAEQDKIPVAFRILDAYPLRQNTRHLLKKVQTANMFASRA